MKGKRINNGIIRFSLLMVVLILLGCSTKKNTFSRRLYHNLTSHYNVYWNGRESFREGIDKLNKKVRDDYNIVLPVFNYGTESDAQSLNPEMDRAIKKASIAIQKHSMVFDGEEKVNWIDDCYMLIGKAYFYKQEYFSARRTFNFVIREYPENDTKYDAMLWLARTYVEIGEFEKVEPQLNLVAADVEDGGVPASITRELPQVYADSYIKQQKYDEAIDYLYEALSYSPPKMVATRMLFALGQIFQENGDMNRASSLYKQVIRKNPPYELAFQAKINMATSYDVSMANSKEVRKILNRMLKDDKNTDYLDQIYYAIAEIDLKENLKDQAIENLVESVKTSTTNSYQKSKSSLRLADLYFELPDYKYAQAYYDTAMMFLSDDFPDYGIIKKKTAVLSELVGYLITIQTQDSLQRLATMTETQRNSVIDKLIRDYNEELRRQEEQQALQRELENIERLNAQQTGRAIPGMPTNAPIGGGKGWYFYNPSTVEYGKSDFERKWGKRKLEDLWRISNKQMLTFGFDDEGAFAESDSAMVADSTDGSDDPRRREYYLKNIPLTPEALEASTKLVKKSYFELGRLYYDGLKDLAEAKETLETLNDRYPDHENLLRSFYYLYKIYEELGDKQNQDHYKNLIITRFPDSDYAKVLQDPEYFLKLSEEESKAERLYEETYKAYESGQYYMVIARSDLALETVGDSLPISAKFEFLRALSVGRVDVLDSLVSSLKHIIRKYPGSEITPSAQAILERILVDHPEFSDQEFSAPGQITEPEEVSPYNYQPATLHMFMMVLESKNVRLNPLKVKISDFNLKYYSLDNLTVNSIVYDKNHYLVTVGNFNNSEKAMKYLRAIVESEYVYSDLNPDIYQNFIISTENYPVFFKEKKLEDYSRFFADKYGKE